MSAVPARLHRVGSFLAIGPLGDWPALAALGWARDNPSSRVAHRRVSVRPLALRGRAVNVDATDLGQLISFEEVFVERAYDLDRVPFQPGLIVDCGAHAGFFSALAGARYPGVPIEVFEPNPGNLDSLRRNLSGLPATLHDAAVSTRSGTARFTAPVSNGGRLSDSGDSSVRMVDLRAHLPSDGTPLLLKMDIEGEEVRVLPHVVPTLPGQCALFLETHDGRASRQSLIDLLTAARFVVTMIRERDRYADLMATRNAA